MLSKSILLAALAATVTVTAVAVPASANATATTAPASSAPADSGLATFVHLPADQAAHPGVQDEWWYTVGHLRAGGHQFGYEVQIVAGSGQTPPQTELALTDLTTGQYYTKTTNYAPAQGTFSSTSLDVSLPTASLSGPMNAMHLTAELPQGTLDLTLNAKGPVLYNDGNGLMPFLGGSSYYYSLPDLATTGTLTENGTSYHVTGTSWLDRQWGNWNWSTLSKWTWMGVQLSNGERLNLWDLFADGAEQHYATVLKPNGTTEVVPVQPLAPEAGGFWTSPTTGQRYATHWTVHIPDLNTTLTVSTPLPQQEVQTDGGIFEGDSTVTGTVRGTPVTGQAYVEQLGNWH
ncbi:lipocalin-like domain-containing protein [Kitasatospora viridis]|uniref:Putative secreted hydrolase n=1 Tax=Kitasatospora viridis TaxID=281105 RepID=A0A561TV80_9ACTN|nr:lipocalin-like domain-containing protein [Kitasatospora viridis]TWF91018.1 putative secreted hydrolase [Kitasatospora viridis]